MRLKKRGILETPRSVCPALVFAICLIVATAVTAAVARAQTSGTGASAAEVHVDVALVLAVDVSRSMSQRELRIQRRGYAAAIASPEVQRAIAQGAHGRIAITFFEWAADFYISDVVPWTIIETPADAQALADRLMSEMSQGARRTSISGGIMEALRRFDDLPYRPERRVIDVSGDGPNNQGVPVLTARDAAIAQGIVINGLPLMTEDGDLSWFSIGDLDEYYRRCVIGGPGSFMIPVRSWDQFPEAVRRKLVLEIGQHRPDAPPTVLRAQFQADAPYDCMIGEKLWQKRGWQFDDTGR